jgi:molecular chaperone HscB
VSETKTIPRLVCWSCGAGVSESGDFCAACGKIQPAESNASYFALLGLPGKLVLDEADLESRFHARSWKLHPDNFVRASEAEREISLDRASRLNDALRALRDPVARVEYLLGREGMRKEGSAKQQAPPELLEEVFELNESLDELREARAAGGEMAGLRARLETAERNFESRLAEVDADLSGLFAEWDRAVDLGVEAADGKKLMAGMNEVLNRRSYIRNLVRNVQAELEG